MLFVHKKEWSTTLLCRMANSAKLLLSERRQCEKFKHRMTGSIEMKCPEQANPVDPWLLRRSKDCRGGLEMTSTGFSVSYGKGKMFSQ